MYSDSTLSVKDATGRQISLLNDHHQQYQQTKQEQPTFNGKRKYHCTEPGCNKSFTTSGHLARHHRIHSGEKNFHCLHPGCPSRFSRQDNMMQHYRTHLSPKSRRHHQQQRQKAQQKTKTSSIKDHRPQLHRHTLVGSESETIHPLVDANAAERMMKDPYTSTTAITRTRRASTMPSSFHPYHQPSSSFQDHSGHQHHQYHHHQQHQLTSPTAPIPSHQHHQHYQHQQQQQHQHHHATSTLSIPHPLVQPLSTLVKPLPMEPESASSPPSYQWSRRPQRAHSASSTSSSSSSFLSPRSPSLSPPPPPPPLIDQTDIIYPKNFIQLPPLQQETHTNSPGHRENVSALIHTVSIFG